MKRGNRYIVAVVIGGSSGGARDAKMRGLLEQHIASAATTPYGREDHRRWHRSRQRGDTEGRQAEPVARGVAKPEPVAAAANFVRSAMTRWRRSWAHPLAAPPAPAPIEAAARRHRRGAADRRRRWPKPPKPGSGRTDQPREGEDHHGEGRQRADRRARSAGPRGALRDRRARALRADAAAAAPLAPPPGARPGVLGVLTVRGVPLGPDRRAPGRRWARAHTRRRPPPRCRSRWSPPARAGAQRLDDPDRRLPEGSRRRRIACARRSRLPARSSRGPSRSPRR